MWRKEIGILFVLSFLIILSGCSSIAQLEIFSKKVERIPLELSDAPRVILERPVWIVITPNNNKKVFKGLETDGKDTVLFGLTDEGFEALSKNMERIQNHILTQKEITKKYREYYEKELDTPSK